MSMSAVSLRNLMGIDDILASYLYAATIGVATAGSALLWSRRPSSMAYQAAGSLLLVIAVVTMANLAGMSFAGLPAWLLLVAGSLVATLAPLLWFYVRDLVAPQALRWSRADLVYFIPSLLLLTIALGTGLVSKFGDPRPSPTHHEMGSFILQQATAFATVTWTLQSTWLVGRSIRWLLAWQLQLKDLFASTHEKSLAWLLIFIALLLTNWAITLLQNVGLANIRDLFLAQRPSHAR